MSFDFDFVAPGYTPPAGDAMDFNFGPVDVPLAEVTLAGTMPGLTMASVVNTLVTIEVTGVLPSLTASFSASRTISLLFEEPAPASSDLVFGGLEDAGNVTGVTLAGTLPAPTFSSFIGETTEIDLAAQLPGVTFVANVRPSVPVGADGMLPGLVMSAEARYYSNTSRPMVLQRHAPHESLDKSQNGAVSSHQEGTAQPAGWYSPHTYGTHTSAHVESLMPQNLQKSRTQLQDSHERGASARSGLDFAHQEADRSMRLVLNTAFEAASLLRHSMVFRHQDGTKRPSSRHSKHQNANQSGIYRGTRAQSAKPINRAWYADYEPGMRPPPGITYPPVTPPPEPEFTCYTPNGDLLFEYPWGNDGFLVFKCDDGTLPPPPPGPEGPIIVPVKAVYIVLNSATLRRVSDNALIKTLGMSLSLDTSSWTWGFDATIQGSDQGLVESGTGAPVELIATINGTSFRLLAEKLVRERIFGKTTIRVSGRGRNALLDAPYAPTMTFQNTIDRTAQQLAADALLNNGVPVGWSVDWGLTDWLVPAGVWTHQGTHVSALNAIAQSAGGYLQPHKTLQTVRILPRYPVKPWAWNTVTPDFVLPADVTVREGIEWITKPDYNRVFVSGQTDGVLGQITRQGTAGDIEAQMVTDPLITHADAARQRGIAILGEAGRMAMVSLSLPVLAETGVIEVGKFVRYEDGPVTRLGLVRSMGVSLGASALDLRQQITVETHL